MKLNQKKQRFQLILNCKLILASSLVLLGCTQVQAQPFSNLLLRQSVTFNPSGRSNQPAVAPPPDNVASPRDRIQARSRVFAAPPVPPGTGAPTGRQGRGSRGCGATDRQIDASSEKHLKALVPESVGGFTTAERPTFWFYVPYQPPMTGEFVLRDRDGNLVYKTMVTLPAKPGAIALSLPTSVAPLTLDKLYSWYFKIRCQPNKPNSEGSLFSYVEGWIQRTSLNPALSSQLQNATPQQKVTLYARNGIWYEALTIAAELYRNNPKDTNWTELLEDVGLGEIASEAIVEK